MNSSATAKNPFDLSGMVNRAILPTIPMHRWGSAGDFGGIAVYLASTASSYHKW